MKNDKESPKELLGQEWEKYCNTVLQVVLEPENGEGEVGNQTQHVASNELLTMLQGGIKDLSTYPNGEAKKIIEGLTEAVQKMEVPDFSKPPATWKRLDQILKIDPSLWEWLRRQALEEVVKGDFTKGAPLLAILAFCKNSDAQAWFQLGFVLYQLQRFQVAEMALRAACSSAPNQPEYALLLSSCSLALGDKEGAKVHFKNAEKLIADQKMKLFVDWQEMMNRLRRELAS